MFGCDGKQLTSGTYAFGEVYLFCVSPVTVISTLKIDPFLQSVFSSIKAFSSILSNLLLAMPPTHCSKLK